jgi:hypothetical protein
MKTDKVKSTLKICYCYLNQSYHLNFHGYYNERNKWVGYRYQHKRKGFWLGGKNRNLKFMIFLHLFFFLVYKKYVYFILKLLFL